jgi:hypothetical protein
MDDRAEIFEFLREVDKKPATDPLTSRTLKREVSATEYSARGEGKYIASVLDKTTLTLPTCMRRPELAKMIEEITGANG